MTKNKKYRFIILEQMLKKYHKRTLQSGQIKNGRRIDLNISKVYRDYEKLNADIQIKMQINEAVYFLVAEGYISVKQMLYSDDIEKIFLNENKVAEIENYLEEQFGIITRKNFVDSIKNHIDEYEKNGELTSYYCRKLKDSLEHSVQEVDSRRVEELLMMLAFIQDNASDLYVREASVLVYGNSKYFENDRRYEEICGIIREATGQPKRENQPLDEILQQYGIANVGQEISMKGEFLIEIGDYSLETKYFSGGISLSSSDIGKIDKITVRTENVMTIENKTSYYRFSKENCSCIYLGGYASRHQLEFIKKIYFSNKACNFLHFGDIDVGGFLIHQHLCVATGIDFSLFHMGGEELDDKRYQQALIKLTENDITRAERLKTNSVYQDVIIKMLEMGVKLEQEIISYTLMQDGIE